MNDIQKKNIVMAHASCTVERGVLSVEFPGKGEVFSIPLSVQIDTLKDTDRESALVLSGEALQGGKRILTFSQEGTIWDEKTVTVTIDASCIRVSAEVKGTGRVSRIYYASDRSSPGVHFGTKARQYYAPRFDWSTGMVFRKPGESDILSCQQWLSPPPFWFGFDIDDSWYGFGIAARQGQWNFMSLAFEGRGKGGFVLDYEGHTAIDGSFTTPELVIDLTGHAACNDGLQHYVDLLDEAGCVMRDDKVIHRWWYEPIFCGWGQQRYEYRSDHDLHENGNWINAGDYATEIFYRRQIRALEEKGINPGIVIIDCFWAEIPSFAKPHPLKWENMRGFIDEQHAKGRKVLLWFTPIIAEGLPDDCCMTLDGKPVAADPTSPEYRKHLSREIGRMLGNGADCLDADGFKIDFTQNIPSERSTFRNILTNRWAIISETMEKNYLPLDDRRHLVETAGSAWGLELVASYLSAIREPMKEIKPDSLLITHTANPVCSPLVDMLRLNDMDGTSPDVIGIMSNRAAIAKACDWRWLIDTDNDLMINKTMWREYIALQARLGNPDTYYTTAIAQSRELFNDDDYSLLAGVMRSYREELGRGIYAGRKLLLGRVPFKK